MVQARNRRGLRWVGVVGGWLLLVAMLAGCAGDAGDRALVGAVEGARPNTPTTPVLNATVPMASASPDVVEPGPLPLTGGIATPVASATPAPAMPPGGVATATVRFAGSIDGSALPRVPVYNYEIVEAYPHDPGAFTQGLIYRDGALYEGTGLRGRSSLREVDLETGQVREIVGLPPEYFGEGITIFGDRLYQLTWQSRLGFVYDSDSFELLDTFNYPTEGWGITHDGERLIVSDGTANLYFWDPTTLEEVARVQVTDPLGPVSRLNELEYVEGEIYANVWQTNRIARIDPASGEVLGWIDLTGLLGPADRTQPVDVLNGIAYDDDFDRLFVTGKLWPKLFEIELVPFGE